MHNPATRRILALLLLGAATLAVYLPGWFGRSAAAETQLPYVVDVDYWQRTAQERPVSALFPFDLEHDLAQLPLTIGPWQGAEAPETNREVFILLQPEQFVQRRYTNPQGQFLWLTLIAGRALRTFHPPDLCYLADGWQTALASRTIPLDGGGQITGLWLSAQKPGDATAAPNDHRAFYFYVFPNGERRPQDGQVLFRVTSPPYGSDEETLAVQADFVRRFFTAAGSAPRQAQDCPVFDPAATDDEAIRALLLAEGRAVVQQDAERLLSLWNPAGRVVDAAHTPNSPADDQIWEGAAAIRNRYLHRVFPGAPQSVQPGQITLNITGNTAEAVSATQIDGEFSPAGDRWQFQKVDGCWQIQQLTYNLEPLPPTQ